MKSFMAICSDLNTANTYANRIEQSRFYCESLNRPLHSESLLRFVVKNDRLYKKFIPLKASRVRVGGIQKDESFLPRGLHILVEKLGKLRSYLK